MTNYNQNQTNHRPITNIQQTQAISQFMSKVYVWMMIGLLLTGFIAFNIAGQREWVTFLAKNQWVFFGILIAQIGLVVYLSARIDRLSVAAARGLYLLYAGLVGVTFSVIFAAIPSQTILSTFAVTAFSFAGLSGFGYVTKKDLSPLGSFAIMGLFGLIGFSLLALFVPAFMSSTSQLVSGIIGVIIFSILTAYDTQKIKNYGQTYLNNEADFQRRSIYGALILYLDFINLFLQLLKIFSRR